MEAKRAGPKHSLPRLGWDWASLRPTLQQHLSRKAETEEAGLFQHSRRRLARSFAGVMGGILVVFAALFYRLEVENRLQAFDEELQGQARIMAAAIKYELRQGQWRLVLNEVPFLGSKTQPLEHHLAYLGGSAPGGFAGAGAGAGRTIPAPSGVPGASLAMRPAGACWEMAGARGSGSAAAGG
ncbi:hypothetical protein [Synechococcus sp. OH20]|uniref:hypothetical protein n=1 Tax=Synechococcus sp. OH20 TaxID=139337 RepID=UPI0039C5E7F6